MTNLAAAKAADVLIIGGGPGGLSAALALARHLHHIIVFDNGYYRNHAAKHMHNVLGWDHQPPTDFRAKAKENILARYDTVQVKNRTVASIRKIMDGFEATDEDGACYMGKKLVLSQGRSDIFPDIKGYGDCWGVSVFHCLFCHGFEERGGTAGLLALGALASENAVLHVARMAAQLAKSITVYTHGDEKVAESLREVFAGKPVQFEPRKIAELVDLPGKGVKIWFGDGESKVEAFLAHIPDTQLSGDLHTQLELEMENQFGHPCIKTNGMFRETSVSGCFAVGDVCTAVSSVTNAMQTGAMCAGGLSSQLGSLKWF
ncbi:hypothetical protein AMS68_005062 [Peltaster fructicola]|uniref:FAD/NAD(P)-binding domain-containing protein n=1 Tax=Peltaster fructicola TaxID=286661 RepID=A0A6H0XY07_9PEZI|nr:hypothetical protein AMS68_005062 [Peltaster fructicola]